MALAAVPAPVLRPSPAAAEPAYSFAAGPARLPDAVLARAGEALFARGGDGAAAIERPFTGDAFRATLAHARERLAALLALPANYRILFMAGGAMQHFSLLPMNLLGASRRAAYADSGYWSRRAIDEGWKQAAVSVVATPPAGAPAAPDVSPGSGWDIPADAAYCHLTPNETADGVAWAALPDTGAVPLVADVTSCFLAAPLDVSRFGLLYAGAQKNIGPAGLSVVVVRDDLLERARPELPAPFSYAVQAAQDSCVTTPPTAAIQLAALVFDWIAERGGLPAMAAANAAKAARLYGFIDASGGFYTAPVRRDCRSPVNVRFHLADSVQDAVFAAEAERRGLFHLRGHPRVGGLRASLYNAMPMTGVDALVDFMADFMRRRG
ncbi:3-phosphoserine/phosphohydroxythreonine transaminase [Azospira restricta]|uniref:Phosphoserine aminotransferase n=1 Tax=Azospira restricta TaxID=404405 RepID=A0A974PXQ0_9RHOO|nr:3-phosphoserine/phosphohydroxythreonine transaminase [Azospira restricta]QRJ63063.1 3-phosphoserine/phosphohydroxythreonine transaminase [Azospira restricta]